MHKCFIHKVHTGISDCRTLCHECKSACCYSHTQCCWVLVLPTKYFSFSSSLLALLLLASTIVQSNRQARETWQRSSLFFFFFCWVLLLFITLILVPPLYKTMPIISASESVQSANHHVIVLSVASLSSQSQCSLTDQQNPAVIPLTLPLDIIIRVLLNVISPHSSTIPTVWGSCVHQEATNMRSSAGCVCKRIHAYKDRRDWMYDNCCYTYCCYGLALGTFWKIYWHCMCWCTEFLKL